MILGSGLLTRPNPTPPSAARLNARDEGHMSTPTTTWKGAERRIARMLGLQRVGNSGRDTPDAEGEHLVAEVKHGKRYRLAQWLHAELDKARSKAGPGRLGVVVIHEPGQAYGDCVVCMRLQDYADWYAGDVLAGASDDELAILAPDHRERL